MHLVGTTEKEVCHVLHVFDMYLICFMPYPILLKPVRMPLAELPWQEQRTQLSCLRLGAIKIVIGIVTTAALLQVNGGTQLLAVGITL